jgi:hypothetical protein
VTKASPLISSSSPTTDMNLGQAHCPASKAPTPDSWREITKSLKFEFQGFICITKFWSQISTLLQAKIAHRGKQMRVGAREGFAYHPVKLVLLANGNRYEVDSHAFFLCEALSPFEVLPCPNSAPFIPVVCGPRYCHKTIKSRIICFQL